MKGDENMSSMTFEDLMKCYNNLNDSEKQFVKDGSFSDKFFNNKLSDYRIIEDVNLVDVEMNIVNRSWKEKLFSIPWKPWIKTKVVEKRIPKQEVYIMKMGNRYTGYNSIGSQNIIVCHPCMINELKNSLNKIERQWNSGSF